MLISKHGAHGASEGGLAGRLDGVARLHRQAGMTAVELLVDLSMLAILASAAVVMTNQYLESGRGRAAAEQVAGAFQQARQYAISTAATYTVTLTGTTVAVACTAGCPPNAPSEPAAPIVYDATTNVPGPAITFNSLGASNAGTVTITYPNSDPWRVQVTAAGRIRTCSPTCS